MFLLFSSVPTWFYIVAFIFIAGFVLFSEWNSRR